MTEGHFLVALMVVMVVIGLIAVWNNWILIDDDGFSPRQRPSFSRFYGLGVINIFRLLTGKKVLSFKDRCSACSPKPD